MNIFKKAYCRFFQTMFRLMLPILPYREPTILKKNKEVVNVLKKNKIQNVLLVTDQGLKKIGLPETLLSELENKDINVFVYDKTIPNPTTENVYEALKIYDEKHCQAIIGFGGGSPIDCAKAVGAKIARRKKSLSQMKGVLKVRKSLPLLIAVPTTAGSGSETTLTAVITDSETRHKYTINDFPLIPKYALLNAKLTIGLPKKITSTTGMDVLTHAVEAYIGRSTTKQTRKCSMLAVKAVFENLENAYENPENLEARENMLVAAYNAGIAFSRSYVGYVHAIAHSLGGRYNIAHGLANAIILPYILKKYGKKIHKKLWQLGLYAGLFDDKTTYEDGARIFISKIEEMNKNMNIGTKIKELQQEDIKSLAKIAEKEANPLYPVPVLLTAKELEQIYKELMN